MNKKLNAIISVLLVLVIALAFTACGEKVEDTKPADAQTPAATEAPTEAPTEPANGIGTVCRWGDATLEVTDITEEMEDLSDTDTNDANGKYVAVVLTVTDGSCSPDDMNENSGKIKLDEYSKSKAIAVGVEVSNDLKTINIVGKVYVMFDVPEDFSVENAVATFE